MSKLWLLTQKVNRGYDTYDSAVVCADTENDARQISPDDYVSEFYETWAKPEDVIAKYIGEADKSIEKGYVICRSFNAG